MGTQMYMYIILKHSRRIDIQISRVRRDRIALLSFDFLFVSHRSRRVLVKLCTFGGGKSAHANRFLLLPKFSFSTALSLYATHVIYKL